MCGFCLPGIPLRRVSKQSQNPSEVVIDTLLVISGRSVLYIIGQLCSGTFKWSLALMRDSKSRAIEAKKSPYFVVNVCGCTVAGSLLLLCAQY